MRMSFRRHFREQRPTDNTDRVAYIIVAIWCRLVDDYWIDIIVKWHIPV